MANPYAPPVHDPDPQPGMGEDYDFDHAENLVIDKVGRRARIWGIISYLIAALVMIGGLFIAFGASMLSDMVDARFVHLMAAAIGGAALFLLITTIVYGVMGKLYTDAGSSLQRVVLSTDNDVFHMMEAIKRLGTAFQIEAILVILTVIITWVAQFASVNMNSWIGQ